MTLVDRLRAKSDKFYQVRERIGFKQKVYLLTRSWDGEIGAGIPTDTVVRMVPTPGITDLSLRAALGKHGNAPDGDIMLLSLIHI